MPLRRFSALTPRLDSLLPKLMWGSFNALRTFLVSGRVSVLLLESFISDAICNWNIWPFRHLARCLQFRGDVHLFAMVSSYGLVVL